jgi:hypothetical protein
MQYDFTLKGGGAQILEVSGSYFKYKGGTGPIRVTPSNGGPVDLMPGQGMSGLKFDRLTVKDISGNANIGYLLAGDGAWSDDRITGNVEVIDGERTRTLAGTMFAGSPYCGAVPSTYSNLQLWNPVDSGKNLIIGAMDFGTITTGAINVLASNLALANLFNVAVANKRLGSAPGVGQLRWENRAAQEAFTFGMLRNEATAANTPQQWNIRGAVVVPPGWGLNVYVPQAATTSTANFEWFEEMA